MDEELAAIARWAAESKRELDEALEALGVDPEALQHLAADPRSEETPAPRVHPRAIRI